MSVQLRKHLQLLMTSGNIVVNQLQPLNAVAEVNLDRYCGMWYEIACLPNSFERASDRNTTAVYSKLADGTITVTNCCRRANGTVIANGIARKKDVEGSNARLEVRFAPSWLSWFPFVWGPYWVIDLGTDYSYSVVSEPSRKYLWILSRTSILNHETQEEIFSKLRALGFSTESFIFPRHDGSILKSQNG